MYYLNVTGETGGVTASYCSMDEDLGCPAGSTLVLKIDGSKVTKYSYIKTTFFRFLTDQLDFNKRYESLNNRCNRLYGG